MRKTGFWILILMLAATLSLWGQQQGGGRGGGGNTGGGGGNTGGRPGGPGGAGGQERQGGFGNRGQDPFGRQGLEQSQMRQRPIFLSGRVVLDDGTAPPESVTITRHCNGERVPETYTDSKGRFSFEVGGNKYIFADASSSGAPTQRGLGGGFGGGGLGGGRGGNLGGLGGAGFDQLDMSGCDLRADLPGYRSDVISLGRRRVFDNPDVGTIVLRRLGGVRGHSVSVTTLAAPKKAKKAYEKASKELRKKNTQSRKPEKAIKDLEKAVAEYPRYAAAWTLLGETKMKMMDAAGARAAFERALEADPRYLRPYWPLLRLEMQQQRWTEVDELSDQILKLNPMLSGIRYFQAVARFNRGHLDAAEETAKALAEGPDGDRFPRVHHLRGLIQAKKGNFVQAATAYRSFVAAQPGAPEVSKLQRQMMDWEALGVIPKQ